jgi:hypothetical protein
MGKGKGKKRVKQEEEGGQAVKDEGGGMVKVEAGWRKVKARRDEPIDLSFDSD